MRLAISLGVVALALAASAAHAERQRVPPPVEFESSSEFVFLDLMKDGALFGEPGRIRIETLDKLASFLDGERKHRNALRALRGQTPLSEITIILRADKDVRYARAWEVLDACKRAGCVSWQLRVRTGEPGAK